MKTDDILSMWAKDCQINNAELGYESTRIPNLHSKYMNLLMREKRILKAIEMEVKSLYKDLFDYYSGDIDEETEKERGWEPNPKRVLKSDIDRHIDSHKDYQKIILKKGLSADKVSLLEEILKAVNARNWIIKNGIDWEKYKAGII